MDTEAHCKECKGDTNASRFCRPGHWQRFDLWMHSYLASAMLIATSIYEARLAKLWLAANPICACAWVCQHPSSHMTLSYL